MKQVALIVVLLLSNLGLGAWVYLDRRASQEFMLRMLYLDSVTQVKNDLYVLTSIRKGNEQEAVSYLERLLETKVSILEGCRNDLCSEETPNDIQEAITLAKEYQERYRGREK